MKCCIAIVACLAIYASALPAEKEISERAAGDYPPPVTQPLAVWQWCNNHENSGGDSQLWLPMCGGLTVAYSQCCGVLNNCEGNSDGLCEMFFDGASALLVNLVNAQERMAKK